MKIIRTSCAEGAREASGVAVVIDVFRAFSCAPLFFHYGARKVILEPDPAKAIAIKNQDPEIILAGEVDEIPIEGGDVGNSPSEILAKGNAFFRDRVVVHRTTAGVTGTAAAIEKADEVLLGSFVMAGAIARYIISTQPRRVTLIAMGSRAKEKAPEDEACADCIEGLLTGKSYDPVAALKAVLFQPTAQKFIQGTKPYLPREDPTFCLQRDLFDFVLIANKTEEKIVVSQEWV
jgi:2-phosphosulfolactate phosphatase